MNHLRTDKSYVLIELTRLKTLCAFLAVFSFVGYNLPACSQSVFLNPHLYHEPILATPPGQEITVVLVAEEGIGDIRSATLLWRRPGGEFRSADLEIVPQGLAYTIPAADVTPPFLEYAILIEFTDGGTVSFPLNDPIVSPQKIAVLQKPTAEPAGLEYVVLYPQEGDLVFESDVRIAVSIFDPDSLFNPATLEVFLDGKPTAIKVLTRTYLFTVVSGLSPGQHTILLKSRNYQGQPNPDFQWSFRTPGKGLKSMLGEFAWSFTGEGRMEDFGGEKEGILRGDFRAQGEVGTMEYSVRTFVSSEEAWDRQPQNRFFFGLEGPNFLLNLGDSYPVFSDLVLSSKRVRGVYAGVRSGGWKLNGVFGEINKPIESSTYRRYLWGLRPSYTSAGGATLGFSLLKAKDDLSSVTEAAASPQDNIVGGFDLSWPLFSRKVEIALSAAMSLAAMDIRGGSINQDALEDAGVEIPFDPEPWEPLIVINESLTPPDPTEGSSLAWTARLSVQEFGHYLSFNYRNIGPSYHSLGNPYLQNDLAAWNLSDQFSLWKRHLFINFGLDRQRDNLRGTKAATTTTSGGWVTLALYPVSPAPTLTLALNYHHTGNGISEIDTTTSNGTTYYFDQRRDEYTGTLSASLVQNVHFLGCSHTISLNANRAQFLDGIENRPSGFANLNSNTTNLGSRWRTSLSNDLNVWGEYSYYTSEMGSLEFDYHQGSVAFRGRFYNRKLEMTSSLHRRQGDEELSRWQANLRLDWEFLPKHIMRADLSRYFNDTSYDEGVYRIYYFKRF